MKRETAGKLSTGRMSGGLGVLHEMQGGCIIMEWWWLLPGPGGGGRS